MKQINSYNDIDAKFELKSDIFNTLNCHRIGIIQSFNSSNQTATIQLVDKKVIAGYEGTKFKTISVLVDCPVYIHSGGGGWINQPITTGDECLVLFNDRNIDLWFSNGNIQPPENSRTHSLQDGLAIVGFHSQLKKLTNFDPTKYGINYKNAKIQVDTNGKVNIQNQLQNLKTLIDSLIEIIKNLKTVQSTGGHLDPVDPDTTTALNNIKTQFADLLI